FLGRNRAAASPAAMTRESLSGRTGPGLDPCAALQAPLDLPPGESVEVVFLLGQAPDVESARRLIDRHGDPALAAAALAEARARWDEMLGAVQVRTPDVALDL